MSYYRKVAQTSVIKLKESSSPATRQERMQSRIELGEESDFFSSRSATVNVTSFSLSLTPKAVGEWTATRESRCMVCWTKIKPGESVTTCPHCNSQAHASHLEEWFRSKNTRSCPRCRRRI
ncbi:MAG: RING finger domain-containing protein [Candidatus Odinarchaeota archaeon]